MGYTLKKSDRSLAKAVRRIARQQIDASLDVLDAAPVPDPEGIHTLRKNIKKLRALLRLVRPVFDDYPRENSALRDAGRGIGGLRDRDVMLALFDQLAEGQSDLGPLRDRLSERLTPANTEPAAALSDHRAILQGVRGRVKHWRFDAKGFDLLEPGLERGVDEARKALKFWRKSGEAEGLHELRKRIKALGFNTSLLRPLWPEMMAPYLAQIDRLGTLLGDSRDHALLADHLEVLEGAPDLVRDARKKAAQLEKAADLLARRLLVEPGDALTARWRRWWRLWRA